MKQIFAIFLLCGSAWAQWATAVNQNNSSSSAASITTTLTLTVGKSVIVFCKVGGASSTITVSDNLGGNTYTGIGAEQDTNIGNTEIFYLSSIATGGAATIACNVTPNEGFLSIIAETGPTFGANDAHIVGAVATGTDPQTLTTTSYSTIHANEFIFLCATASISTSFVAGAFAAVTGFVDEQNTGAACQSATLSSTQTTQTATISASSSSGSRAWNYGLASFQYTPVATNRYFPQMR